MRSRWIRHYRLWRREGRPTLALALPIIAGTVGQMLMGLADAVMVGRVGVIPLAASTLVNALAHLPLVFGIGLLSAVGVLTSQAFGARRPRQAGEVLRHGLVVAAAIGALSTLSMLLAYPFLGHLGQPPEVVAEAGAYLLLFGASLFPALLAQGCKQFSDALKHPWVPTFILLGGVALNVLLNWVLIYGNWGAPAMGLEGAGWATLVARIAMVLALCIYVLRVPALRRFHPARWRVSFRREQFRSLLKLGVPVGVQHFMEVSAFVLAALMMGWISADAIAAHQIAITCAAMTFMFAMGIGIAVSIRVGHAYGAAQYSRMRRIGFSGLGMAVAIMAGFAVVFITAGRPIIALFVESETVIALGAQLLIVAAVFQIADGTQVVSISALRGLGDVRVPAVIAVLAYWVIALPVGSVLAFALGHGALGIWIGLALGLMAAAAGLSARFYVKTGVSARAEAAAVKSLAVEDAAPS